MAIQWFPGHMHKAKKAIAERMKTTDVVIEVLDARLPGSSANPLLENLSERRPKLKILNKQDLADPVRTEAWLAHYNNQSKTQAIALDASEKATQKLIKACRDLVPNRGGIDKPLRVLICGIPNVGKSTLINSMMGKRSAKTGNEPGITKQEQRIFLADDFWLFDTPGMLWPKIIVEEGGYNLAASGAVGRNALDEEEVSLELLDYLRQNYPEQIVARFKLDVGAEEYADWHDNDWFDAIARKRGALLSGGRVDYQKVAEIILTDYRAGLMGRVTLETPEEWMRWLEVAKEKEALLREERAAKKAAR
ncbi:ribosome biogenesis GTPase YlqF [Neisseriaceae bacterium CLB008]|nr:ribosome biogenesis GTPase YlqF [Neisseriaceae bacterium]